VTEAIEANRAECRRCSEEELALFEQVKAQMPGYIGTVGGDMRVTDEEYRARLEFCYECAGLAGGVMCRYCGCFVQMRALKKHMHCPNPDPADKKW
jgi:hypothetical protein